MKGDLSMARQKPHTLVATVGTSLMDNLNRLTNEPDAFYRGPGAIGAEKVEWSVIQRVSDCYRSSQWKALGKALQAIPDTARLCGAEINSIAALNQKERLDIRRIVFFVSDTPAGEQAGEILKAYYEARGKELGLQKVDYRSIDQLQDERPLDFRTFGLRNLVREVGKVVRDAGDPSLVAIDATGGYKPQIAVAAVMGIALDIDVYYKHERFERAISFPPLPVTLDYELLGRYGRLLSAFENGGLLTEDEVDPIDEELRVLLEHEVIDDKQYWALSPIGEIYLTGFRLRNPKPVELRNASAEERKPPTFRDDHYPAGFKEFVTKVWRETPWITRCFTKPYDGQASMKRTGFDLRDEGGGHYVIIGIYVDRSGFGGRFEVNTTSSRRSDLAWAVDQLNQKFGGPSI
ncbi:MAG: putative CRISPR-associated protein [Firmicutes bacterium]|nr:putative CRISPR-associated protein [Bacillota bacterium]